MSPFGLPLHDGYFTTSMKPILTALKFTAMPNFVDRKANSKPGTMARKVISTLKNLMLCYMTLRSVFAFYVAIRRNVESQTGINNLLGTTSEILWSSSTALSYLWMRVKSKNMIRVVSYLDEPFMASKTPFYTRKPFVLGAVIISLVVVEPVLIFNLSYHLRFVTSTGQILIVLDAILFNLVTVYSLLMFSCFYFLSCLFLAFKISTLRDKMMSNTAPDGRFLVRMSESYTKACEMIQLFDQSFSPYLLTSISSEMMFVCYASTTLFTHFSVNTIMVIVLVANASSMLITSILLSARVGSEFRNGVTGVTQMAVKVPIEDTLFHQQAIILTQHISSHSKMAQMTVGGLFAIQKETMVSAFLGILSYCVIFTQMQTSEVSAPSAISQSIAGKENDTFQPTNP